MISGNIATADGAKRLYNAGADVCKAGVGSGSLCSTRIEAASGVPQMTALYDVYVQSMSNEAMVSENKYPWNKDQNTVIGSKKSHKNRKFKIIADGGISPIANNMAAFMAL